MTNAAQTLRNGWIAVPLLLVAASAVLVRSGWAQADARQLDRRFTAAVQLHQSGDVEGAIREYQALLAVRPDWIDCRSNLGAAYARLGRYQDAIEQYSKALLVQQDNLAIRFNLGLAYYKALMIPEAGREFSTVLNGQPSNKSALLLLADCRIRMGEYRKAIDLLSPHEQEWVDDHGFDYLLGTALLRVNEIRRAQFCIDRIMSGGETAEAALLMGTAQLMAFDYPKAVKEFEHAIQLNPRLPSAHAFYGRALLQTGDREGAVRAFEEELTIDPNDFESSFYMGVVLKEDQKYDEALAYLVRAQRIRPAELNVYYYIGGVYLATGRVAEAGKVLEELVRQAPDFVEAHVLLATAYYRLKRKAEGDRERAVIQKLNAEAQSRAPGAGDALGPPYRGEKTGAPGPRAPNK